MGYLAETLQIRGPFLVVVPLSTVPNWIREFRRWVPFVNAVVYVGDSRSREVLRAYECEPSPHHRASRPHKFEVLLTTYELILKDAPVRVEDGGPVREGGWSGGCFGCKRSLTRGAGGGEGMPVLLTWGMGFELRGCETRYKKIRG